MTARLLLSLSCAACAADPSHASLGALAPIAVERWVDAPAGCEAATGVLAPAAVEGTSELAALVDGDVIVCVDSIPALRDDGWIDADADHAIVGSGRRGDHGTDRGTGADPRTVPAIACEPNPVPVSPNPTAQRATLAEPNPVPVIVRDP